MPKLRVIIKPPPEPQGDAKQQTEALRDYLLQMSEELAYVLTHLEADNINDSTFERIQGMIPRPYTGLPVMDGDASSGQSEQWARGDHRHGHDSTKADVTALETHEADTNNPHEVTKAQVGLGNVADERQYSAQNPPPIPTPGEVGAIPVTEKGSAGGVAELDSNGVVPSAQLPESLALGETSSTAYRGDRGKIAYDHSQTTGNPHGTTAAEVGARPDDWMPSAADVGLGNVENERQYSAQNPPPYPVTSVNGRTGAVSLDAVDVGARPDNWIPDAEDVPYDNTQSGLMATDVQAAIDELAQGGGGGGTAAGAVSYDNTGSGLAATNVQGAIDEVYGDIPAQASDIGAQDTITANGILKGDGAGGVSAATAGTDYQAPLTAGTDYATPAQLADKANQSQLAYVETGTTASRNYTAGDYICWNSLLYTADTAIASGATFYTSGGNKNLTECVGGGLNSLINNDANIIRTITPSRADVFSASRSGKMVQVCVTNLSYNQNFTTDTKIAEVSPAPDQLTRFALYTRSLTALLGFVDVNGNMYLNGYTSGALLYGSFCYLTK